MTVSFAYDPDLVRPGSEPMVLHEDSATGLWLPEVTITDPVAGTATAIVGSFSGVGLADRLVYMMGAATGNRSTSAIVCSPAPDWIVNTDFTPPSVDGQPANLNAPLWSCPGTSDNEVFRLQLQNNRSYVQTFRAGLDYDLTRSSFPSDLSGALHAGFARLTSSEDRRLIVLAPGEVVTLAFQRPADLVGTQQVVIAETTTQTSTDAAGMVSLLTKVPNPLADGVELIDCAVSGVARGADRVETLDKFQSCVNAATAISGAAKTSLARLAWGVFAIDVFVKLGDLYTDAWVDDVKFEFKGLPAVTADIKLTNGDLGQIPAGQVTIRQLAATGSVSPYTFRISTGGTVNDGRVPSWATLTEGGQLHLEPPTGTDAAYSFYVTIRAANNQSSPYGTELVSFQVTPTGIDPPNDPRAGTDWIARNPDTGTAVQVRNGAIYRIADGATFSCLAQTRVVWDIASLEALRVATVGDATCDNTGRTPWTFTPTAQGGNTGTNIILRNPTGNAWLINSAGEIQTIPDGGTYLCLARANPVVWNVPTDNIHAWAPVGGTPAACGGPGGPARVMRVSVASDGTQGNNHSGGSAMSGDGRYMAYTSSASNLVLGDSNQTADVFVFDQQTRTTTRASVASDGTQANQECGHPAISADGRYITYTSSASNLVPGDTNNSPDVFVFDQQTRTTTRVSIASNGTQANSMSGAQGSAISGDGRYITYYSWASDLVPSDVNGQEDVFLFDRQTETTVRVTEAADTTPYTNEDYAPAISGDGRYIVYYSLAPNLVPEDTNGWGDVFLFDRQTGTTARVSVASDGTQADRRSLEPSISADGRYITYSSFASNLVPGDPDDLWAAGVFVVDRHTGTTTRVSVASDGTRANNAAFGGAISADGRYVAYSSYATNLVPGDTGYNMDLFVFDRQARTTTRVSVAPDGTQVSSGFSDATISADGRYIGYSTDAWVLVPADNNNAGDVFVTTMW